MRARSTVPRQQTAPQSTFAGIHTGLLQRKCACGGTPGLSGECETCRKKKLQRHPDNQPAPPSLKQPRFGHDFARVNVLSHGAKARRLDVTETAGTPTPADAPDQSSAQPADDPFCLHTRPGEGPERCEFTPRQQRTLSFVRYAALSMTSQAYANLGRGDPYMSTLAGRIFHVQDPDMDQIAITVSQILDNLRSKPIVCGTCADEDCYTPGVVAHVTPDLSTVVLCQRFFQTNVIQMRRTLIHEAGHAAGVDASLGNVAEHYCSENSQGCVDPCSNLSGDLRQNVDAWARFIECAASSG
jgi:hypothetical protein